MKSSFLIPKEHGAWAMVYAPLLVVIAAQGEFGANILLFLVAVTAVFLAHEPLILIVRMKPANPARALKWRESVRWLIIYLAAACGGIIPLLWLSRRWYLLPFGLVLGGLLAAHIYLASRRSERGVAGEFLGVLGMTLTAPGAYYVVTGRIDRLAALFWILNLLYFTSGIFYVKMRVSKFAKKENASVRAWQCAAYHLVILVTVAGLVWYGMISSFVAAAFAPVVFRAFWAMLPSEKRLSLKRIGWSEVAYTIAFIVFAGLGLRAG